MDHVSHVSEGLKILHNIFNPMVNGLTGKSVKASPSCKNQRICYIVEYCDFFSPQ